MFDAVTSKIIEQAAPLKGLDVERLPQDLTSAYAKIVSLRVAGEKENDIDAEIEKIERIGKTYLALVLSTNNEHCQSMAFVAASAYALISSYRESLIQNTFDRDTVCYSSIAALLFVIANSVSDASEVVSKINTIDKANSKSNDIVQCIKNICNGDLQDNVNISTSEASYFDEVDHAVDVLYSKCIYGMQNLSLALLGDEKVDFEKSLGIFKSVKQDSVFELSEELKDMPYEFHSTFSTFPGPFILSSLLIRAGEQLIHNSIFFIPPPEINFKEQWRSQLKRISRFRPYLWPNHFRAIYDKGVLRQGTSAVFSLPTGAGKTTLSDLKIASTLISGGKVIFLAPTHALVQQVSRNLKVTFPNYIIKNAIIDGEYVETEDANLADIAVMTPERCLAFLMFYKDAFAQVKLVIFDECHILHADSWSNSYRASDSMMCLLRLFESAKDSDYYLLSAMIENAGDIAGWIEERLGRPCFPIQDEWKPTRQLKGCVVYGSEEIMKLERILSEDKVRSKESGQKNPGIEIKRQLNAHPWAFFGLKQVWDSRGYTDYIALPMSENMTKLSANKYWKITPNKLRVASSLAVTLSSLGVKTLVFVQQIDNSQSVVDNIVESEVNSKIVFTDDERKLLSKVEQELGNLNKTYVPINGIAACHHGLLLKEERELVEMIFKRADGVSVLVATPTLAQGMNLPAAAVILAGDERWDSDEDDQTSIEAHELLNAAGRAGRAGQSAKGIVLIIPSKVVAFKFTKSGASIGNAWDVLRKRAFSKNDQCLTIVDPLEKLLDAVQDQSISELDAANYLFRRMPYYDNQEDNLSIKQTFNKSLASYVARKKGVDDVFQNNVQKAVQECHKIRNFSNFEETPWMPALATELGVTTESVVEIYSKLDYLDDDMDVYGYLDWARDFGLLSIFLRPRTQEEVIKDLSNKTERSLENVYHIAQTRLINGLKAWCRGATLEEMSDLVNETTRTKSRCKHARKLALRWAPEVGYSLGTVTRMCKYKFESEGRKMSTNLATLASLIRHGVDMPVKLAILHIHQYHITRIDAHRLYNELSAYLKFSNKFMVFKNMLSETNKAYDRFLQDMNDS